MNEKVGGFNKLKSTRTYAALILASVALAGCGDKISADDQILRPCGENDYSESASSDTTDRFMGGDEAINNARKYALTLQHRALRNNGEISLPRYINSAGDVVEIKATRDDLTLRFDNSQLMADPQVDHVRFPIKEKSADISQGAIMCFDGDGKLTVNGTYESLEQYTLQTSSLDR